MALKYSILAAVSTLVEKKFPIQIKLSILDTTLKSLLLLSNDHLIKNKHVIT